MEGRFGNTSVLRLYSLDSPFLPLTHNAASTLAASETALRIRAYMILHPVEWPG
jgi:hypothetical protein